MNVNISLSCVHCVMGLRPLWWPDFIRDCSVVWQVIVQLGLRPLGRPDAGGGYSGVWSNGCAIGAASPV